MYVPFGKWTPDQPRSSRTPHLLTAKNCVPLVGGGYGPLKRPASSGLSLVTAQYGGAISLLSAVNQGKRFFTGSLTKLYCADHDDTAWTNVTRAVGGNYTSILTP